MNNLEKLLAVGAKVIIQPTGREGLRFLFHKYAVCVEYQEFRNGLLGNDLEELFSLGLEWTKDVDFMSGEQWTPEQVAAGYRVIRPDAQT